MAGLFRSVLQAKVIEINAEEQGSLAATSLRVWGLYVRGDSGCRRVLHGCTDIRLLHGGLSNGSGYGWLFHYSVNNDGWRGQCGSCVSSGGLLWGGGGGGGGGVG